MFSIRVGYRRTALVFAALEAVFSVPDFAFGDVLAPSADVRFAALVFKLAYVARPRAWVRYGVTVLFPAAGHC